MSTLPNSYARVRVICAGERILGRFTHARPHAMARETSGIADRQTAWQAQRMRTGWAIIIAAVIIAATGSLTAWALTPRYSMSNPGAGVTIRLNRASGDLLGCERLACRPIVEGQTVLPEQVPPPPTGYTVQNAG